MSGYDFNATYKAPTVYNQDDVGSCWSHARGLAIVCATIMHTGHEPKWIDDGDHYPQFRYIADGLNWNDSHWECEIEGITHKAYIDAADRATFDWKDPNGPVKEYLDTVGFAAVGVQSTTTLSWAKDEFKLPILRHRPDIDNGGGGHALLCTGYTDDGLIIQNSWTLGWGYRGRAIMSWDWMQHWNDSFEFVRVDDYPLKGMTKTPQPVKENDMATILIQKTSGSPVWAVTGAFRSWVKDRRVLPIQGLSMNDVKVVPETHDIWKFAQVLGELPPGGVNA